MTTLPRPEIAVELFFSSGDESIDDYYEFCFKDWFTRELTQVLNAPQDLSAEVILLEMTGIWNRRMLLEAEIQEHYSYDLHEVDGKTLRFPRMGEDGKPELMIPTISLVPTE